MGSKLWSMQSASPYIGIPHRHCKLGYNQRQTELFPILFHFRRETLESRRIDVDSDVVWVGPFGDGLEEFLRHSNIRRHANDSGDKTLTLNQAVSWATAGETNLRPCDCLSSASCVQLRKFVSVCKPHQLIISVTF